MTFRFRVAPGAEAQIRDAANWWIENRPKAPEAFAEDLERAFEIIWLPATGEPVSHSRLKGLRRLLMGRVRYSTVSTTTLIKSGKPSKSWRFGIRAEALRPRSRRDEVEKNV